VSNSPWDEQVVIKGSPTAQAPKPQWPWEQPERIQRHRDFLREHICEVFLVRIFDETARYMGGYGRGFNFVCEDGATFAIRASCLTPRNGAWACNFGRIDADFILFFGFRGRDDPNMEFCLDLPLSRFGDRDRITILDDGYHIKGYREFGISDEKLAEMRVVMDAIRRQDSAALEGYLPRHSK